MLEENLKELTVVDIQEGWKQFSKTVGIDNITKFEAYAAGFAAHAIFIETLCEEQSRFIAISHRKLCK